MKRIEAPLLAKGLHIAIISTRWNHFIVDSLVRGACSSYRQHGGDEAQLQHVIAPGAYELPLIAKHLAERGDPERGGFNAIVCLGAVIRGDTGHYEHVAGAAASGILNASLSTGVPITFGLLTTEDSQQALERAGIKAGNKGAEAMLAAIETANLLKQC